MSAVGVFVLRIFSVCGFVVLSRGSSYLLVADF
jgi:hypothetical protein